MRPQLRHEIKFNSCRVTLVTRVYALASELDLRG